MAGIILKQAVMMLLLNLVGMIAYRTKIVDAKGGRQFSAFVLEIVTPVLVVTAYADVEYQPELVKNLLWTFVLAAAAYGIVILLAQLLIRKKDGRETAIERFSVVYSPVKRAESLSASPTSSSAIYPSLPRLKLISGFW